jgi:hypothetical protein
MHLSLPDVGAQQVDIRAEMSGDNYNRLTTLRTKICICHRAGGPRLSRSTLLPAVARCSSRRCAGSAPRASSRSGGQPLSRRDRPRPADDQGQRRGRVCGHRIHRSGCGRRAARRPVGASRTVKFGLADTGLWRRLGRLTTGPETRSASSRCGLIRDGVLLSVG